MGKIAVESSERFSRLQIFLSMSVPELYSTATPGVIFHSAGPSLFVSNVDSREVIQVQMRKAYLC